MGVGRVCFTCLGGFVAWRNPSHSWFGSCPSVCERVQPSPYLAFLDSFLKTMMMNKTNFLSGFAWEFLGTCSPVFWEGKVTKNHMKTCYFFFPCLSSLKFLPLLSFLGSNISVAHQPLGLSDQRLHVQSKAMKFLGETDFFLAQGENDTRNTRKKTTTFRWTWLLRVAGSQNFWKTSLHLDHLYIPSPFFCSMYHPCILGLVQADRHIMVADEVRKEPCSLYRFRAFEQRQPCWMRVYTREN